MNLPGKWAATGCLAVLAASLAPAQSSSSSSKDDFAPSKTELDFFAGAQLFHKRPDPLSTKLLNSTEFGVRVTENLWNHWSFEQSLSGGTLADLTLLPVAGAGSAQRLDLEQRVWKLSFSPVYHLTPLGSRFRPYLAIGYTQAFFDATKDGKLYAQSLKPPASSFTSNTRPAMNYGGGVKYRFTDLIGMRIDIRGIWSDAPTWGLPPNIGNALPAGSLYIPKNGSLHGIEANAGIVFYFGGKGPKPAPKVLEQPKPQPKPQPEPVKPPAAPRVFELSALTMTPASGYASDTFTFSTRLTDSQNASGIQWSCTVDGVPVPGVTGPGFSTSSLSAGSHQIQCTATDPATGAKASTPVLTMSVQPIPPLTITDASDKSELHVGETARLTAQGSQTDYSGPLTYSWKTNVGDIQGSGSAVTFVSANVQFDPANVFKPETRTATVTPTVTDSRGRTATGSPLQIQVIKDPQAMRLDDIIYGKGSSRVNNCAKRILIDELQGLMNNNPDVEVLLIGHVDSAEATKTAKGTPINLDHQRVYNAAAVLTAGTGVCAKCDLARVKVAFAGTDQTSDFRSGFCGTSTRAKSDERKADDIAADDAAAKNRRVEIWIVPKGVATPGGAKNVESAPVKIIKAKGCPK